MIIITSSEDWFKRYFYASCRRMWCEKSIKNFIIIVNKSLYKIEDHEKLTHTLTCALKRTKCGLKSCSNF